MFTMLIRVRKFSSLIKKCQHLYTSNMTFSNGVSRKVTIYMYRYIGVVHRMTYKLKGNKICSRGNI